MVKHTLHAENSVMQAIPNSNFIINMSATDYAVVSKGKLDIKSKSRDINISHLDTLLLAVIF